MPSHNCRHEKLHSNVFNEIAKLKKIHLGLLLIIISPRPKAGWYSRGVDPTLLSLSPSQSGKDTGVNRVNEPKAINR